MIYAHRGLHGPGVPENSLAADAAVARGFGIECDVQRSHDGQAWFSTTGRWSV
jgi:glycerophosphoryl diester phosphodiesterase